MACFMCLRRSSKQTVPYDETATKAAAEAPPAAPEQDSEQPSGKEAEAPTAPVGGLKSAMKAGSMQRDAQPASGRMAFSEAPGGPARTSPGRPSGGTGGSTVVPPKAVPEDAELEEDDDDCASISSREEEELEAMAKLGTPLPTISGILYIAPSKTRSDWSVNDALKNLPASPPDDPSSTSGGGAVPGSIPLGDVSTSSGGGTRQLLKNTSRLSLLPTPGAVVAPVYTVSRMAIMPSAELATMNARPISASGNKLEPPSALELLMQSDYGKRAAGLEVVESVGQLDGMDSLSNLPHGVTAH